ncbi:unnamed protein product [Mytilus coruscus]|uniref:Uncharacterized protein n=1 Tax=Mytilus coruscus TaxID=42192 RepID=A0A6J8E800_MYTCO|nr:unnamed protein product [Mytilus coruscus]
MPKVMHMVICEEKYSFTPDHFKAATRTQRQVNKPLFPITHLKTNEEILSSTTFDKTSLVTTMEGKSLISTFIARNIEQLKFKRDIIIDIDSEYIMEHETDCPLGILQCHCQKYTTPIRYKFDHSPLSRNKIEKLPCIKQCKGEAEMAQVDWLIEYVSDMEEGTACASIVTSGDIDAVTIHMFALCHLWPRNDNSSYKHPVYIILQKPGSTMDIYNITAILELLEKRWNDKYIGIKIAIFLCLGGNDFLPKFYNISHLNVVNTIVATDHLFQNLVRVEENEKDQQTFLNVTFSQESYRELIKLLYCPKTLDSTMLSFEEIRQLTVKAPTAKSSDPPRNYALWMPAAAAVLNKLSLNINCLIKYYLSAGQHTAILPNFLQDGCLLKLPTGEIEYNLGSEASVDSESEILIFPTKRTGR